MKRQDANRELLTRLSALVEAHPEWRFGQLLVNAGVVQVLPRELGGPLRALDPFAEESSLTLRRVLRWAEGEEMSHRDPAT